ncbi:ATP-binding protein [Streptosporangiaceae bacterium NEAU-GS5]|nr:ATP-binding protein [Streptosporangiaceae bacterium NEAU-GS5]
MNEDGVSSHVAESVKELSYGLADLPAVREFAADQALRRGMPESMVGDFLVALNEVATNAVTHGAAKGRLRLWREGPCLVTELFDEGTSWRPVKEPGMTPPAANATSGMGLWVARRLSETLGVVTGVSGTTVTMRFRIA